MLINEMISKYLSRKLDEKKHDVVKLRWEKARLEKLLKDLEAQEKTKLTEKP